jgi:hypothetical protein
MTQSIYSLVCSFLSKGPDTPNMDLGKSNRGPGTPNMDLGKSSMDHIFRYNSLVQDSYNRLYNHMHIQVNP